MAVGNGDKTEAVEADAVADGNEAGVLDGGNASGGGAADDNEAKGAVRDEASSEADGNKVIGDSGDAGANIRDADDVGETNGKAGETEAHMAGVDVDGSGDDGKEDEEAEAHGGGVGEADRSEADADDGEASVVIEGGVVKNGIDENPSVGGDRDVVMWCSVT